MGPIIGEAAGWGKVLATRLEDPRQLADPRYGVEPKLDGQRSNDLSERHR
jgi:hypothetical protein